MMDTFFLTMWTVMFLLFLAYAFINIRQDKRRENSFDEIRNIIEEIDAKLKATEETNTKINNDAVLLSDKQIVIRDHIDDIKKNLKEMREDIDSLKTPPKPKKTKAKETEITTIVMEDEIPKNMKNDR